MNRNRKNNITKTHLFRTIGRDLYNKMERVMREDIKIKTRKEIINEVSEEIETRLRVELMNENNAYMVELSQLIHDRNVLENEMKLIEQEFIKLNFEKDNFEKEKYNFYKTNGLMENIVKKVNGMEIMTDVEMMESDVEDNFSDKEEDSNNESEESDFEDISVNLKE